MRVCVRACLQKFVLTVFCSLLCDGLRAPVGKIAHERVHYYYYYNTVGYHEHKKTLPLSIKE